MMKLTYRGTAFEATIAGVPSLETGEMGVFLGKPYPLKRTQSPLRQPAQELIYRGVRYSR